MEFKEVIDFVEENKKEYLEKELKQNNCKHENKEYYNHGYHCVCRDCGKDLD